MKKWNPFGMVDIEISSFIKNSRFNKEYKDNSIDPEVLKEENNKPK